MDTVKHTKDHNMAAGARETRKKSDDGFWDTIKVIIQALLIAFAVRMFLYQPFNIPSESMYPTLKVGDYLFVSKLSYGYSKYSFNFGLNLFGNELFKFGPIPVDGRFVLPAEPKRGDVAVFKLPLDNETDYIKRVIGLPGDRVQMREGVLYINGQAVPKQRIADFVDEQGPNAGKPVPQYVETLPNGVSYNVLDLTPESGADNTQEYLVPAGNYFMMGDNRDNSLDSRYAANSSQRGVDIIFFSIEPNAAFWQVWKWPTSIRWLRFFNLVN